MLFEDVHDSLRLDFLLRFERVGLGEQALGKLMVGIVSERELASFLYRVFVLVQRCGNDLDWLLPFVSKAADSPLIVFEYVCEQRIPTTAAASTAIFLIKRGLSASLPH